MTLEEHVLARVVSLLETRNIPYMVTGSIAVAYHGHPRATKVHLILRKERPFSVEEFGPRQRVDMPFARATSIVMAEDSVLSKLEWARQSGDSERQLRDAAGVVELNPSLDRDYVARWAVQLGVADLWERIASA